MQASIIGPVVVSELVFLGISAEAFQKLSRIAQDRGVTVAVLVNSALEAYLASSPAKPTLLVEKET